MDTIKYQVLTKKKMKILEQNQYIFDVDIKSNNIEIKKWIKIFFNVKVFDVNSHHLPP